LKEQTKFLWISQLDDDAKEAIYKNLLILKDIGPSLGRPHVDSIKQSKHKNMKELRVKTKKDNSGFSLSLIRTGKRFF
jgi:hypothetical protein